MGGQIASKKSFDLQTNWNMLFLHQIFSAKGVIGVSGQMTPDSPIPNKGHIWHIAASDLPDHQS